MKKMKQVELKKFRLDHRDMSRLKVFSGSSDEINCMEKIKVFSIF